MGQALNMFFLSDLETENRLSDEYDEVFDEFNLDEEGEF